MGATSSRRRVTPEPMVLPMSKRRSSQESLSAYIVLAGAAEPELQNVQFGSVESLKCRGVEAVADAFERAQKVVGRDADAEPDLALLDEAISKIDRASAGIDAVDRVLQEQ